MDIWATDSEVHFVKLGCGFCAFDGQLSLTINRDGKEDTICFDCAETKLIAEILVKDQIKYMAACGLVEARPWMELK